MFIFAIRHCYLAIVFALSFTGGVDCAIKIISAVDHVGGSRGQQHESGHRKHGGPVIVRPGHNIRIPSDSTIEKLINEKPGAYLYAMLMSQYNVDVLPVNSTKQAVEVRLLLKLTQMVEVDEKNQIMTTNVWLRHEWYDSNLKWDPKQFGGIETLYIPAEEIWLPDTILYNNADGDYQITIQTKVEVRYDGLVVWEPPSIYKSFCFIDVEFFPYDSQKCEMKFGPWTFDVSKVDYFLMNSEGNVSSQDEMAVDMSNFYESVEWDILKISGSRRVFQYPCCEERYVDITYNFHIRRKTLFYTINLIIPCVMISFLTVLVFYLPCQSGEKIALSISTLLSLTWFILLLSEIIPPTSLSLPLMGKYLLFTIVLVALSIAVTVLVLYNHFRHPYAFTMPCWIRYVFLDVLPKLMFYQVIFDETNTNMAYEEPPPPPSYCEPRKLKNKNQNYGKNKFRFSRNSIIYSRLLRSGEVDAVIGSPSPNSWSPSPRLSTKRRIFSNNNDDEIRMRYGALLSAHEQGLFIIKEVLPAIDCYMAIPEVQEAIKCVHFISNRYRSQNNDVKLKGEWEAVSRVLDRFFLIVFSAASFLGTMAILLMAPSLYDKTPAMEASDPGEIVTKF